MEKQNKKCQNHIKLNIILLNVKLYLNPRLMRIYE